MERTKLIRRAVGGAAVEFQTVPLQLAKTDLVIVATRSSNYVLTKDSFSHRGSGTKRKLMILDLSNPRNVEPGVRYLDNVIFKTIDYLLGIAYHALPNRLELLKNAE